MKYYRTGIALQITGRQAAVIPPEKASFGKNDATETIATSMIPPCFSRNGQPSS